MYRVLDSKRNVIGILDNPDLEIKKEINKLKVLSCSINIKDKLVLYLKEKCYIESEDSIYRCRLVSRQKNKVRVEFAEDIEEIAGKILQERVEYNLSPVSVVFRKIMQDIPNWTYDLTGCDNENRSIVFGAGDNAWNCIEKLLSEYRHECKIDSKNKKIIIAKSIGEENGVYFTDELNLLEFEHKIDRTNFYTRLYVRGKDNLSIEDVNNGKPYVEDFTYTDEIVEGVWEDKRYKDPALLLKRAKEKIKENNKPLESITVNVKDLSKLNKEYDFLGYDLGDNVTIIDSFSNYRETQRVVSITEYPHQIGKNKVTIANILPSYKDVFNPGDDDIKDAIDDIINSEKPPINESDFPDTLPSVPKVKAKQVGLSSIEVSWTYENKLYYTYEFYASETKGFQPSKDNLIYEGQASVFLHECKPSEKWYYRCRAKNTHNRVTNFSEEVVGQTFKISDASYWFEDAAIGQAVIGELSADKITTGKFKGTRIDARELTVIDGNNNKTLEIDSFGRVKLNVTELSVLSKEVETVENSITKINTAKTEALNDSKAYTGAEIIKVNTTMNNKLADFKITTDAIAQKVSQVENTTTTINGKVNAQETRLAAAEQKITPTAIINTVQDTVNQARNDAISTSSKEISRVEQKVNEVTYSFQDISNENLLDNSSFEKEETYTKNHPFILDRLSGGDGYPASLDGGKYIRIYTNDSDSYFVKNTSIKIKPNTAYTISFYYCCTQSVNGSNYVFINGNPINIPIRYIGDRSWHRISYTFRTSANIDGITAIRFGLVAQGTAWLLLDNIQIEEGEFLTKWKAKKDELCTGVSFIDAGGMGVRHEDGSFTKMTANGFKRYIASSGYDYHYLTYIGKTQKLNINPVTVQLPNDFKGKDFKVSLSLEEIANPAGWFVQSVQLLVGNINKTNGTFQILGGSQSQFHDGTQGTMKPTTISYTVTA